MSFLGNALARVKSAFVSTAQRVSRSLSWTREPVVSNPAPGLDVVFRAEGFDRLAGMASGLVRVTGRGGGGLSDAMTTFAADTLLDEIRKAVSPISRTGELQESFGISQGVDGAEVFSSARHALTILGQAESWGNPSIQSIMGWADHVPEFEVEDSDLRQVAGAIFFSWDSESSEASPNSRLFSLPPVGQKAYDYVGVAIEQSSRVLDNGVVEIARSVVNESF